MKYKQYFTSKSSDAPENLKLSSINRNTTNRNHLHN